MKVMILGFLFAVLGGCTTGHLIRDSNRSLDEIRAAIISIAGEQRDKNENRRVFLSTYFPRKKDPHFDPQKSKERLYAKFSILGDRRPYDIQVQVFAEERVEGVYEEVGVDEDLTDMVASDLKKALVKGRAERNVIDDFRAF